MSTSNGYTLGFVSIARSTFDIPLAAETTMQARQQLRTAGFTLVGPDDLVMTVEQAERIARALAGQPLDLLVVFQATFADSTMIMALAAAVNTPLVLWAMPELPGGKRLRLNALCGINLAGHALTRAGARYEAIYAAADDDSVPGRIRDLAQAGRVRRMLDGARIGRIGEHPDGFDTCRVNYEGLQQVFGINVCQFDLPTIFEQVRVTNPQPVAALRQALEPRVAGLAEVDQAALRGTLSTYVTLRELARQERLDGFAVRCWPQFFTDLKCAFCGAASLLNDDHIPASCETDVNGTVTQLILQWISGEPAFDSDIVAFDTEANTAVFWHCGKAPLAMADPAVQPRAQIHSNRQLPLLMEFPLKPGRVTLARLSEATGSYRLVIGSGEVVQAPISFTGTSGVIRFDSPAQDVLNTILGEGLEHHLALTYGDHVNVLLAFARMVNVPVLRL